MVFSYKKVIRDSSVWTLKNDVMLSPLVHSRPVEVRNILEFLKQPILSFKVKGHEN